MKEAIKTAENGIAEEYRNMGIGDVIKFPFGQYNPLSVRNAPSGTLFNQRIEGKKWITSTDSDDECVYVIRVK